MSCGCTGKKVTFGTSNYTGNNTSFNSSGTANRYFSNSSFNNNGLTGPNSSSNRSFGITSNVGVCPPSSRGCGTSACGNTSTCGNSCGSTCGTKTCGTSQCGTSACNSCNKSTQGCPAVYDACGTGTATATGNGTGNGTCGQTSGNADTWPPSNREVGDGTPVRYKQIYVPGDYPSLAAALDSMGDDVAGYVVHLNRGTHTLGTSFTRDVKFLRIEGVNTAPFKGVGYLNGLGQWDKALKYNGQYNSDIGGLAPWVVAVSNNGFTLTVTGSKNPNFTGIRRGEKLVFYHTDGTFTEHNVCSGCGNTVTVNEAVDLGVDANGCQKCDPDQGEGFYIRPDVTLRTSVGTTTTSGGVTTPTSNSIRLTVEGRLEYSGIHFRSDAPFVTGATGGFTETEHSAIAGNMIHIGIADWYKPNVVTCKFTVPTASQGTFFYQTVLGMGGQVQMFGNPPTNYSYAIVNGARTGVETTNFGSVATTFTDFFNNDNAVLVSGGSRHDIRGARFINNAKGVVAIQNSSVTALQTLYEELEEIAPTFFGNDAAIEADYSSLHNFEHLNMGNNNVDLTLDGTMIPNIALFTSGTYGGRYSTLTYSLINILPPP